MNDTVNDINKTLVNGDHPDFNDISKWDHYMVRHHAFNYNRGVLFYVVHKTEDVYRTSLTLKEHYTIYGGND